MNRNVNESAESIQKQIDSSRPDTGVRLSFSDLRERTIRAALNLQARGYKPNQVFTIIARNSEHLAPIVFASFCIGCPINVLDTSFGKNEIKHLLGITKPNLVFCDADVHDRLVATLKELGNCAKIITFNGKVGSLEQVEDLLVENGSKSTFIATPLNGVNHIAAIMCSSGTTSLPKGVSLSHAALLNMQSDLELIQSNDIMLNFSQLYWITGMMSLLWGTLFGTTRIITTEQFSPELAFRLIPQYKVSCIINGVYQMVSMLKNDAIDQVDLTTIKRYFVGGSKVPFGLASEFNKYFPNGETYIGIGMTEVAGLYALAEAKNSDKDTVGHLASDVVAKIVDDYGNRCGVMVDGEVCLKLRYNFLGYYDNPEATKQAIDSEGFLLTGDIGHFDEDGNLYIVDRKKDLMKYCSYQITPTELEAVLLQSPEIEKVCVVGIPDIVATDLPAVAVVRKEGSRISAKDIYDIVADSLADQYRLRGGVYFVDSFPTTASRKALRREVKAMLIPLFNGRQAVA